LALPRDGPNKLQLQKGMIVSTYGLTAADVKTPHLSREFRTAAGATRGGAAPSRNGSPCRDAVVTHKNGSTATDSGPSADADRIIWKGKCRSHNYFTPAKLDAFVAVAEEGGLSAASRRLHVSQSAVSQTISALERQLGVQLLLRSATGMQTTHAGKALLAEARSILARHDQLLRTMAACITVREGVIRLGISLELAPNVLGAITKFTVDRPLTRVQPIHSSTAEQLSALRSGQLDVSFLLERPSGPEFDAMLVATENLGVLLTTERAARLVGPDGIELDALAGLEWVGFPRSHSPAWYDQLAAILHSHGIAPTSRAHGDDHVPIPSVTFTAVSSGHAFAVAPPLWAHPTPEGVVWTPLAGNPVVRRTWAVWPADSRHRDVARLLTAFGQPETRNAAKTWPARPDTHCDYLPADRSPA
jgi:DNA-binding transcriptional LysR family regulator